MQSVAQRRHLLKILKAGGTYFVLLFGAGFILGPLRILFVTPRWRANCRIDRGTSDADCHDRCGEVGAAKIQDPTTARDRLSVGMIALTLMLFFEFTLVLKLRGLTLAQYFRERDPVSGVLYYLMLGMFALLSLLIGRERSSEEVRERRVG